MRKHSHRFLKRLAVCFVAIVGAFMFTSCTQSFCTPQDQANQLYGYYGNIFEDSVDVSNGSALDNITVQNENRETLYGTLETNGFSRPTKAFNNYMNEQATTFASDNVHYWFDGTFASYDESNPDEVSLANDNALHVAIYAGITTDEDGDIIVAPLWTNYNEWYDASLEDETVGVSLAPSNSFVSAFQAQVNATIASNTACITPEDSYFNQNGVTIYIQGKTWGEAFSEYGFLEGLFVYPFSWLVHTISEGLGNNGWAQILAIFTVTLIARLVTVVSTVLQGRSQAKQQKIQPMINDLQAKYPNAAYDKEQKQQLAFEQAKLIKQAKVHPVLPLIFLIIQFPIFICVWSALQGNASLAASNLWGLALTTPVSQCFMSFADTPGALTGIMIFIFMTLSNVLSSFTSLWFTNWRTKNFGTISKVNPEQGSMDPQKTTKIMTYVMLVFIIIMGWSLPAGMGIYWIFGSLLSILQSLITEVIQTHSRHKLAAETGDGSNLAIVRRSAHHRTSTKKDSKKKKDKPMWR